jgi:hypothetical protein
MWGDEYPGCRECGESLRVPGLRGQVQHYRSESEALASAEEEVMDILNALGKLAVVAIMAYGLSMWAQWLDARSQRRIQEILEKERKESNQ